jgi:hypothetical protein
MQLPNGQKSKLEKLEQKLYSVDGISSKERAELKQKKYTVDNDWEDSVPNNNFNFPQKKKIGFFTLIFILAAIFFVGSLSYAGYIFLSGNQSVSGNDVDLKIIGPVSVAGGEALSVDAIVSNNNKVPLELVDLFAEYPEGSKNSENISEDLRRVNLDLGTIAPGSVTRQTVKVALFGEEGANKQINFILQYRIPGSNAIFEKKKTFEIALNATPVRLSVSGLEQISSGQPLELTLKVTSNSPQVLKNVMVNAEYPFGFKYEKSDLKPKYDNNIWVFDELKPNEEITFKISGTMEGQNQEDRVFRFNAGLTKEDSPQEMGVLFITDIHQTQINKSFIGLVLNVNKNPASVVTVNGGQTNEGELVFTNNTNDPIKNLEIKLQLVGSVLDETSVVVANGFYRSIDNMIIWNKETDSAFLSIAPRQTQHLSFRFKTSDLSSGKLNILNPQVDVTAKVSGTRISTNNTEESISSDAFKNIKVLSDVSVYAYTNYDKGPFVNSGPIPPKVDTPTTYSLELNITNDSNDLENGQITAILPTYVSWKNNISPGSENVSYDSVNRKITWNIGNIPAGTGYTKLGKQLYFQVELLPSISQKNSKLSLLDDVFFTAKDTFTRTSISKTISAPTTAIKGYPIADGHENVVE